MSDCVYPCPCGYYGGLLCESTCSLQTITRYQKRISGPLLDRIDIHKERFNRGTVYSWAFGGMRLSLVIRFTAGRFSSLA